MREEEIVMPAEQTGPVRDNYLWKCLMRRAARAEYVHAPAGALNHEVFGVVWGQTVAALCFVYDRSGEGAVVARAIEGFGKCAQVAAAYGMSDVFDNIVISLCKFTALSSHLDVSTDGWNIAFFMNLDRNS